MSKRFAFFCILLLWATKVIALEPVFFDSLEQQIREDYHICTGNSKDTPLKTIIEWKSSMDSLINADSYSEIVRNYIEITGLDPQDVRPCEPIAWNQRGITQQKQAEELLRREKEKRLAIERDSLSVVEELSALESSPADFKNIPAHISRRSFEWLIARTPHSSMQNRGLFFQADSIPIGEGYFRGIFYFGRNGTFNKYRLESYPLPADSVNTRLRADAELLSSYYQEKIGSEPEIHHVGFLDIQEDEPSLYRSWKDVKPVVTIMLSTRNHKYFTECVIDY